MRPKILSKRTLLIVVPLGGILLAALLLNFIPKTSIQSGSASLVENVSTLSHQNQAIVGLPTRLKIPGIGVDTAILSLGLTANGAMDVPKSPTEVAWFNLGPRPGKSGSAVIAGHYDWTNNMPAVFANIHKLRIGDKIYIEDEKGVITAFVVSKTRVYGKDEIVPEVFISNDGKARLNLITCTGSWNKAEKTYSNRLVVFTEKE